MTTLHRITLHRMTLHSITLHSMTVRFVFLSTLSALTALAALAPFTAAQTRPQPAATHKAAGAAHPAASVKVSPSPLHFDDVTHAAGIDFHLTCGSTPQGKEGKQYIMDSMCGGVAVFDYDHDGWMDIFLVNGSTLADMRAHKCNPSKLYRNNHDGSFTDVTKKAGLEHCRWGFGVAIGDYDNDGWDDLYITNLDGGTLYRNNGNGTFSDVTAKAQVDDAGSWGTSVSFGDYDNDGFLDLYVTNYVDLDLNHLPPFGQGKFCSYRGIPVSCGPRGLKGSRDRLYHNNGDGTFSDVTEKLGIDPDGYFGLGMIWLDYDNDGCLDLYVADDSSPSQLYHNKCKDGFHGFEEVGVETGLAYSADGREQAGMGVDSADFDHDGWLDIAKINFSDDTNNLYRNDGHGGFEDVAGATAFGPVSAPFLGFGVKFADFDNDGWDDVFVANGHVNPQVDHYSFGVSYAERPLVFHSLGRPAGAAGGHASQSSGTLPVFEEVGLAAGPAVAAKHVARGLASADFWNRGETDLLMTVLDGSPILLRNGTLGRRTASQPEHHWVSIQAVGTKSNRNGYGARVDLLAGGEHRIGEIRGGSSFLSSSDPRLHFGLGNIAKVERVTIRWPSGRSESWSGIAADQVVLLREGTGHPAAATTAPVASH